MPLLLECLHAYDAPSRAAASSLLLTVARCTHPRLGAHAPVLWGHMLSAFCRDLAEATQGFGDTLERGKASSVLKPDGEHCKARSSMLLERLTDQGLGPGVQDLSAEAQVVANILLVCRVLVATGGPAFREAVEKQEASLEGADAGSAQQLKDYVSGLQQV